jgi:hypothetical protein
MTCANQQSLALAVSKFAGNHADFSTAVVPPPRPVLPPMLFVHRPDAARRFYRASTARSTRDVLQPRSTGLLPLSKESLAVMQVLLSGSGPVVRR